MSAEPIKPPSIKLPESFEPPREWAREEYVLEVLAPKHNEMDYDAWQSSIDALKGIFGPKNDWPPKDYTKEQNLKDLENHYKEFEDKYAYTYSILSPDRSLCIGCVYILPSRSRSHDVRVYYWFRNSHIHLESLFHSELQHWLENDWQLKSIAFPGRTIEWDEYGRLIENS